MEKHKKDWKELDLLGTGKLYRVILCRTFRNLWPQCSCQIAISNDDGDYYNYGTSGYFKLSHIQQYRYFPSQEIFDGTTAYCKTGNAQFTILANACFASAKNLKQVKHVD